MTKSQTKARSATLAKGLEILNFLGSQNGPVTLRTVMSGLGMTKPTAHRLLATLIDHGMARFDSVNNTYQLGMRLFELSRQVWQDFDLRGVAMNEMRQLHAATNETVSLAILTPDGGVYIDGLQSSHHLREQSRVGQRVALWRSAIGKALIAGLSYKDRQRILEEDADAILNSGTYDGLQELSRHLDLVNARGYAIEIDEDLPGISGTAAPIVDHRGITVAAIGLSGASNRLSRDTLHRLGPSVIEATRLASLQAGGAPRPVSTAPQPQGLQVRNVRKLADFSNLIGESPTLSRDGRILYWVDICRPCIFRLDLTTGETDAFPQKDMVTAVAETADGLLVAGLTGIRVIEPVSGRVVRDFGDPEAEIPTNRFNDGKLDARGRFWVGSLAFSLTRGVGSLYRVDPDGSARRMESGLTLPNGMGWSPDGQAMYLVDTADRVLYIYDFDAGEGTIANRRDLIRFPDDMPGSPDGIDIDPQGNIFIAMWDGWAIVKYAPDGTLIETYGTPFPRPTSCAFADGPSPRILVTSARIRVSSDLLAKYPSSGATIEMLLST